MAKGGRHGYPSRASINTAVGTLAQAIEDAERDGYQACLAEVEREVYSCDSLDELLAWLKAACR